MRIAKSVEYEKQNGADFAGAINIFLTYDLLFTYS